MTTPESSYRRTHWRPSLPFWRWIGRFLLAYVAAVLVSAFMVPVTMVAIYPRFTLMSGMFEFAFFAIGVFSILPAAIVFAVVLWLRLPPMRYIAGSAGLVGLVGALMVVTDSVNDLPPEGVDVVFIAAAALCGLIAGFVFCLIAFRGTGFPSRPATPGES